MLATLLMFGGHEHAITSFYVTVRHTPHCYDDEAYCYTIVTQSIEINTDDDGR